jgi:hypothetical protein
MHGKDLSDWFYRDPPGERPADVGYFVGYRIAESYYNQAKDKKRAIRKRGTSANFGREPRGEREDKGITILR